MWLRFLTYVLVGHFRPALGVALLFGAGLAASLPVARLRLRAIEWLPLQVLRAVMRLMGRRPGLARMAGVIWVYNCAVMFLYMATGFHPILPHAFAAWSGLNIGLIMARAGDDQGHLFDRLASPADGRWRPSRALAGLCGALVLLVELPCFWYAVGMGVSLGREVQAGGRYLAGLGVRTAAYGCLIVPALLASAAAESVAIRAASSPREETPPG